MKVRRSHCCNDLPLTSGLVQLLVLFSARSIVTSQIWNRSKTKVSMIRTVALCCGHSCILTEFGGKKCVWTNISFLGKSGGAEISSFVGLSSTCVPTWSVHRSAPCHVAYPPPCTRFSGRVASCQTIEVVLCLCVQPCRPPKPAPPCRFQAFLDTHAMVDVSRRPARAAC